MSFLWNTEQSLRQKSCKQSTDVPTSTRRNDLSWRRMWAVNRTSLRLVSDKHSVNVTRSCPQDTEAISAKGVPDDPTLLQPNPADFSILCVRESWIFYHLNIIIINAFLYIFFTAQLSLHQLILYIPLGFIQRVSSDKWTEQLCKHDQRCRKTVKKKKNLKKQRESHGRCFPFHDL